MCVCVCVCGCASVFVCNSVYKFISKLDLKLKCQIRRDFKILTRSFLSVFYLLFLFLFLHVITCNITITYFVYVFIYKMLGTNMELFCHLLAICFYYFHSIFNQIYVLSFSHSNLSILDPVSIVNLSFFC